MKAFNTRLHNDCDILSCISDQNDGCEGPQIFSWDGVQWSSTVEEPRDDSQSEPKLRHLSGVRSHESVGLQVAGVRAEVGRQAGSFSSLSHAN